MKILLTTLNAKYIHKNLALRWIYQACPYQEKVTLKEYTIKDDITRIASELIQEEYDIICLSTYIWNIEPIKALIQLLKKGQPSLKIVVGGPEVSYESFDLIHQGVDAISIGEGEQSIWEYCSMIANHENVEIEGIYTQDHPNTHYRKVDLAFLEQLENPYFMAMDQQDMDKRYLYLETSRGCPYGCEYCLSSCDRQVRMFSDDYVMHVLDLIKDSSVKQVKLLDRTFNANPKRALRIAKKMNEECVNQIFQFEIVAETLSEELLTFFEQEADKTRFRFEIGVQSFHGPTLEAVGRIQNNQRLKEVITRLKDAQVIMHVDLIAGLPYEDLNTFKQSFDELFALGAKELQLGMLKLLKGTKLKQKSSQYHFTFENQAPYTVTSTKWLTPCELQQIHDSAEAVEKFWNSGKCRYTIQTILEKKWVESAFDLFMALGERLSQLPRPYAPQQFFAIFFDVLKDVDQEELTMMLYRDYYGLFKQRPPHFAQLRVDEETKKQIIEFAIEQGFIKDQLYRYATITYAYDQQKAYQIVLYHSNQSIPQRYLINETITQITPLKNS